jgi:hypothetical protein
LPKIDWGTTKTERKRPAIHRQKAKG